MEIIAHRGLWFNQKEKNSIVAFKRAFSSGIGTETDLRDFNGKLVISHDPPLIDEEVVCFEELLELYNQQNCVQTLAINIKSDGLQRMLCRSLKNFKIKNYFLFDMSVPDMIATKKAGLNYLARCSDIEPVPTKKICGDGLWLDEIYEEWITGEEIVRLSQIYRYIFIVSPELHSRNHLKKWALYRESEVNKLNNVVLCTDFPFEAISFFES